MFDERNIIDDVIKDLGVKEEELEEELEDEEELEEEELLEEDLEETEDEEESLEEDDEDFEELEDEEEKSPLGELEFKSKKPTSEEKTRFAFEKLRKENQEKKAELERLDEIAKTYGYDSHKIMLDALEKDAMAKKAAKEGIDPKFYEDLQKTKRELEALKRQREEDTQKTLVTTINSRIDDFLTEKGLSEQDKVTLITKLEDDGFTLNTLAGIKNYKQLFSGYMIETISERDRQKQLEKEGKRKRLSERKLETTSGESGVDLEKLVANMLKSSGSDRY